MLRQAGLGGLGALALLLAGCSRVAEPAPALDPAALRFDGARALERVGALVRAFPRRHSGTAANAAAAEFVAAFGAARGLECRIDRWEVTNFSARLPLGNAICERRGSSGRSIVVVAHHDQSPNTIEGADNDGSGVAILLGLMEIFASEAAPRETLVFLAADAEEWGMLGSRRYVQTHSDPGSIVAAISLDNLGKRFYDGLIMEPIGQFRGYGPIELLLAARAAARAAGVWVPRLRSPIEQVLDQAVPISFMDQGPFVAAGVPGLGFAGWVPEAHREEHWQTYHSEGDTLALQGAESLHQAGRAAEALIRHLEGAPAASVGAAAWGRGPYLYSETGSSALRGWPLAAIFAAIVGVFAAASAAAAGWRARSIAGAWRRAGPEVLALWAPLWLSVVVLRLLVEGGLMLRFELYPATPKDAEIFHPRWAAVGVYVASLAAMLAVGRWLARRSGARASFADRRSLGLGLVAAGALYVALVNPFSLLFVTPALAWLGIRGRSGAGRALDLALWATGGLVLYALIYFFGFVILRNGFGVLWYLMMVFAIGMVSLPSAAAIAAVLAGGVALVVRPVGAAGAGEAAAALRSS